MKRIKQFRSSARADGTIVWVITDDDGQDHWFWMKTEDFQQLLNALNSDQANFRENLDR